MGLKAIPPPGQHFFHNFESRVTIFLGDVMGAKSGTFPSFQVSISSFDRTVSQNRFSEGSNNGFSNAISSYNFQDKTIIFLAKFSQKSSLKTNRALFLISVLQKKFRNFEKYIFSNSQKSDFLHFLIKKVIF